MKVDEMDELPLLPLTKEEIVGWVESLGDSNAARLSSILDLLKHANEDCMSFEDRRICCSARDVLIRAEEGRL